MGVRDLGRWGISSGLQRAKDSAGPIAWVSLAAGVAYALAEHLLGHRYPFYAAVAAFSALGFSPNVQPRRVGEVALGVTVGVGIGEAIQTAFGSGPVQTTIVVFLAAMLGRVLDPSVALTTQSSVQAIVVLGLPALASTGGPVGRWTEALLGGLVALGFSLFIPKDPRRRPRRLARDSLNQLAGVLETLGQALATGDTDLAEESLARARRTQHGIAEWEEAVAATTSTAKLAPGWRRHRAELVRLSDSCEFVDRAIRGSRVLARRSSIAIENGFRDEALAGWIEQVGLVAGRLGTAYASGAKIRVVLPALADVAHSLDLTGERDPMRHTLVSLLRSVTLDLMRAAGATQAEAVAAFR